MKNCWMIRVSRSRRDSRGRRISPGRAWFGRARAATRRAIAQAGHGGKSCADIYGADSVRVALAELFFDKCAYCEYPLARTDPNVEHYRPKASVAGVQGHLGYYWLSYDWRNLLPSCTLCNQPRRERRGWPHRGRLPTAGKADAFPLVDETQRAYAPSDDICRESPLLINPCIEDPGEHLTFDLVGGPVALSEKGRVSIEAYNLNSSRLNKQRRIVIERMLALLAMRKRARGIRNQACRKAFLKDIRQEIERLKRRSAPYAGAARAVTRYQAHAGT